MSPRGPATAAMRVLMLGPGEGVTGGIAALVAVVRPALARRTDLRYLPTVSRRPLSESGRISLANLGRALSQYARYAAALLRFRPDVVHVHTSLGVAWLKDTFFVALGKACGRRVVVHVHGGAFDREHARSPAPIRRLTRAVLARADAVLAVSDELRLRLAGIAPPERLVTLRNCVDAAHLRPRGPREPSGGLRALLVGTVGRAKGAHDLLEAMAALAAAGCDARAWIAGYEESEGDLARARARAAELRLGDRCAVLGPVDRAATERLLAGANVFVLPSYAEGLPMALLEAMAAGLAVVATPVGGIPEVVRDGHNGFLVPPGDVAALADRLRLLAEDPARRTAMGAASLAAAERELDVAPYVERLAALYPALAR